MDPSTLIDKLITNAPIWQGKMLKQLREIIHDADPDIKEEWKWNTAVFSHGKMICAISSFKDHVKINFFNGAQLNDSDKLFNNGLDSKKNRSIDFFERDSLPAAKVKKLVQAAVL